MSMSSHFVCPFCFKDSKFSEVEFECEWKIMCKQPTGSDGVEHKPGEGEPDERMAEHLGKSKDEAPYRPHHFKAHGWGSTWKMPRSADCDWCGHASHTRVCPKCHSTLPETIDSEQVFIVALIGTRGSGKSTYVGVLIHEMIKRIFHPFHGTFLLSSAEDQEQYSNRFEDRLYQEHHIIDQTKPKEDGNPMTANRPILGTLKLDGKGFFKKVESMTLVFFDSAGEDWEKSETLNIVAQYVAHAAGLIFLIDPLAIPNVRSLVNNDQVVKNSSSVEVDEKVSDPAEVINKVSNLIRHQNDMNPNEKINIPVAAAFSKLDVLEDHHLLPTATTLSQPSPHVQLGQFDDNDRRAIDMEIQGLLMEWDNGNFVDALDVNYTNYSCFAFSAFGRAPEAEGAIAPPMPKRIEDAMLWILHQRGAL